MNKLATILLCVNFITVLFPQPGYIHPDEFFQSSEIVAGDVLGVAHVRAWEFNASFPVRSIVFPYMVTSPSLYLLRYLNSTGFSGLQISAVKVVMATRLPLAFLSVFGYLATGRLANAFSTDKYLSTVLYCSSYISWTYYTRTFSNSVEAVILALVLLLILCSSPSTSSDAQVANKEKDADKHESGDSDKESKDSEEKDEDEKDEAEESSTAQDSQKRHPDSAEEDDGAVKDEATEGSKSEQTGGGDAKETTQREQKQSQPARSEVPSTATLVVEPKLENFQSVSFLLGALVMAGFFNRPTFLVFAFVPVLYWLWSLKAVCSVSGVRYSSLLLSNIFYFSVGASVAFVTLACCDTFYYNSDFPTVVSECLQMFVDGHLLQSVKHFAASLTVTPWNFLKYNMDSRNLAEHGLHPRFTHVFVNLPLLLGPLFLPFSAVCMMSVFQLFGRSKDDSSKNRTIWLTSMAIVPVLSLSVFPHQEPRFLIPALPIFVVSGAKLVSAMTPARLSFFALWAFFNILLTLVYGYMHQAALIPALSIFQQKLASSPGHSFTTQHAIFYKTYPPPRHMLLVPPSNQQVFIYDLAGAPAENVTRQVDKVRAKCGRSDARCQIYVFLPSTSTVRILDQLAGYKVSTTSICPHLSMESPPRFRAWWRRRLSFDEFIMDFCMNILAIT